MSIGPSIAITVIVLFAFFIVWGRSSSGQTIMTRIFGPTTGSKRTPRKPANAAKTSKPTNSTTKPRVRKPVPKIVGQEVPPKATRSATRKPSAK